MRTPLTLCCLALALSARLAAAEPLPPEDRTLYYYAEWSWAVGTMHLGAPLKFKDGAILVFPSQISDLLWAPNGTKPRNVMLVYEVAADDKDKPFFQDKDVIFAPLRLLPDHSYWRDNLPNTRRHEVAGGRRYAFRGDDIPEVRRVLAAYLTAHDRRGMDRWTGQVEAVADGLLSPVGVVREDSVHWFAVYPTLARDFDDKALASVTKFLDLPAAPEAEKAALIDALTEAKLASVKPALDALSSRDDATGAAALLGLQRLGETIAADRLLSLSKARSAEVRAYAAEALGERAGKDPACRARAIDMLDAAKEDVPVREAAARGLGASGDAAAFTALVQAVGRGDGASRAAAMALATGPAPGAGKALSSILVDKDGEAAIAAATALGRMKNCPECVATLREQRTAHRDASVRNLIGVVLEVPVVHKHL